MTREMIIQIWPLTPALVINCCIFFCTPEKCAKPFFFVFVFLFPCLKKKKKKKKERIVVAGAERRHFGIEKTLYGLAY